LTRPRLKRAGSVGGALLLTLASTVFPGSGHLVLRRRIGYTILGTFLVLMAAGVLLVLTSSTSELLGYLTSARLLLYIMIGVVVLALAWIGVVISTYLTAIPRGTATGQRMAGGALVAVLCAGVVAPFGYVAYNLDTQRDLLNSVFPSGSASGGTPGADEEGFHQPRINVLLIGSDAGDGRIGTRTDTMITASIDTRTGRTTFFALPRNTQNAQFPAGSKLAKQFPDGFTDPKHPDSSEYLLNALYTYGTEHPDLVPPGGPSKFPGLNLIFDTIGNMLGLDLDYYIEVNMAGFSSIVDALGGVDVNVGPDRVPMGGIGPFGEVVKPFGYIDAGQQHLTGDQALWFARSRTNTSDYTRMGRQRCLIKYIVEQNPPSKILDNFRGVAQATSDNVSTNIPQEVLPAFLQLAGKIKEQPLESISFDPSLPNPRASDGKFNSARPDYQYMRQVVQAAINPKPAAAPTTTTAAPTTSAKPTTGGKSSTTSVPSTAPPTSLDSACAG
jgi:LCP family protein required for cell wall assembly